MRKLFATGLILPALIGSAWADKPVEPAETAHQAPEASSFFRAASVRKADPPSGKTVAAPNRAGASWSDTKPNADVKRNADPKRNDGPSKRVLAQQQAIKALPFSDGDWRGPSKVLRKDGWAAMTETQHVETLAEGTIRTIESRGYEKDGRVSFSMFAVISYDPDEKAYSMRSYSNGRVSDHPLDVAANGFGWEYDSGPQMTVRYEATLKNGVWTQTATRIPAKGEPEKYVEFSVRRAGAASKAN